MTRERRETQLLHLPSAVPPHVPSSPPGPGKLADAAQSAPPAEGRLTPVERAISDDLVSTYRLDETRARRVVQGLERLGGLGATVHLMGAGLNIKETTVLLRWHGVLPGEGTQEKEMLIEKEVPTKLSGLLRLAVECGRKCEIDPRYVLHGRAAWHEPRGGKTRVDLGGAVLAKHVGISRYRHIDPEDTPYYEWLHALDAMRAGDFFDAFEIMEVGSHDDLARQCAPLITEHFIAETQLAPWSAYLQCADLLEAAGL